MFTFPTASVDNWAKWEGKKILFDGEVIGDGVSIPAIGVVKISLSDSFLIPKIKLFKTNVSYL